MLSETRSDARYSPCGRSRPFASPTQLSVHWNALLIGAETRDFDYAVGRLCKTRRIVWSFHEEALVRSDRVRQFRFNPKTRVPNASLKNDSRAMTSSLVLCRSMVRSTLKRRCCVPWPRHATEGAHCRCAW